MLMSSITTHRPSDTACKWKYTWNNGADAKAATWVGEAAANRKQKRPSALSPCKQAHLTAPQPILCHVIDGFRGKMQRLCCKYWQC
jgi:hypothetical protein